MTAVSPDFRTDNVVDSAVDARGQPLAGGHDRRIRSSRVTDDAIDDMKAEFDDGYVMKIECARATRLRHLPRRHLLQLPERRRRRRRRQRLSWPGPRTRTTSRSPRVRRRPTYSDGQGRRLPQQARSRRPAAVLDVLRWHRERAVLRPRLALRRCRRRAGRVGLSDRLDLDVDADSGTGRAHATSTATSSSSASIPTWSCNGVASSAARARPSRRCASGPTPRATRTCSAGPAIILGAEHEFPVTPGAFQTTSESDVVSFVVKFATNGDLVYATFLGRDHGTRLVPVSWRSRRRRRGQCVRRRVDGYHNMPVTPGAYQSDAQGVRRPLRRQARPDRSDPPVRHLPRRLVVRAAQLLSRSHSPSTTRATRTSAATRSPATSRSAIRSTPATCTTSSPSSTPTAPISSIRPTCRRASTPSPPAAARSTWPAGTSTATASAPPGSTTRARPHPARETATATARCASTR